MVQLLWFGVLKRMIIYVYLHSIMVQLLSWEGCYDKYFLCIYIPLWFNYYDYQGLQNGICNLFTFHYGSITILFGCISCHIYTDLHSIMVQLLLSANAVFIAYF